ncbi:hypothetical protein Tco_0514440 [Tanacetum coccineum]
MSDVTSLVRESTFGFKPGINNNRNIKSRYDVENLSPQSTPQVLPSIEENTPPVTYLKDIEETLGTPIEVEHLNETKLEKVGLNCNHNTPLSSRENPNFDGPEPQPLLNSPSLDEMFDDDWRLESKEVSPLGEELSLFDRPNEVDIGRIQEAHRLEPILQQQNYQRMTPSHHGGLLYLMRRSLEVLRKFHCTVLGGRFNQLSHVSSSLLSKPYFYRTLRTMVNLSVGENKP